MTTRRNARPRRIAELNDKLRHSCKRVVRAPIDTRTVAADAHDCFAGDVSCRDITGEPLDIELNGHWHRSVRDGR